MGGARGAAWVVAGACWVLGLGLADGQRALPYQDQALPTDQRVADLASRMTLDEKISQLTHESAAIPRLGVPAYNWWSEGLHGVARSGFATLFPQAIGMAATWNAPLLGQVGTVISTEARAKYNEAMRHDLHSIYYGLSFWSPNINIFRDPRWGRGQETYGEDPYLTSRLGVAFVEGLQGTDAKYLKVIATPKHFAVHSGPESTRHTANVEPSPHDLWDTYLPAFRATITEGKADSIMCAYNAVDGDPACASKLLLGDTLRRDWGFQGFVTSDCGAIDDFYDNPGHHASADAETAAVAAIKAGTDTSCGDTFRSMAGAIKRGLATEADVDVPLKRLLTARFRLGMFDDQAKVAYASIPFSEVDSAAHRDLALKTARESMVLLKNDGVLPLQSGVKTIAVIGPNAASLIALEGNYNAIPSKPVLPVDGIESEFSGAKVLYAQGSPYAEGLAMPAPRTLFHPDAESETEGLKAEYFAKPDPTGKPVVTRVDKQIDFDWSGGSPAAGVPLEAFAVRWTGTIGVPTPGAYTFRTRVAFCYPCGESEAFSVFVDGKQVSAFVTPPSGSHDSLSKDFTLNLTDSRRHALRVEYVHKGPLFGAGVSLDWIPKAGDLLPGALAAAEKANVVLAFVGLSPALEGEEMPVHVPGFSGGDRTDVKLPEAQEKMLEAVAATGKPMVVVLLNGSALAVNWAKEHAAGILEAWYPGEAGGTAIAETLSGKNNPAGRLPVTFYTGVEQLPAFDDYGMKDRTYRYFKGKPLFEFGDGLSYTTFGYSGLRLSARKLKAGDALTVKVSVKNTGKVAGDEVAEVYLTPPETNVSAVRELVGFKRVHLEAGESRRLSFVVDARGLSQVDEGGARHVESGEYGVRVAGSQVGGVAEAFAVTGRVMVAR